MLFAVAAWFAARAAGAAFLVVIDVEAASFEVEGDLSPSKVTL